MPVLLLLGCDFWLAFSSPVFPQGGFFMESFSPWACWPHVLNKLFISWLIPVFVAFLLFTGSGQYTPCVCTVLALLSLLVTQSQSFT